MDFVTQGVTRCNQPQALQLVIRLPALHLLCKKLSDSLLSAVGQMVLA
jgi:hypothetical protein